MDIRSGHTQGVCLDVKRRAAAADDDPEHTPEEPRLEALFSMPSCPKPPREDCREGMPGHLREELPHDVPAPGPE